MSAERLCAHCFGPLRVAVTGRPRRFCSDPCRIAAFRARHSEEQAIHGRAHGAVAHAIATGVLVRQACVVCGDTRRPEGHHHHGYGPDAILDVVWLCSRHHKAAHREAAAA